MKRKHITLFVLLAAGSILMTGCAGRSGTDSSLQETPTADSSFSPDPAVEGNSADGGQNAEEESAGQDMADKTAGAVLEQNELPFPLGQEVNVPNAFTGTVYLESLINADEVYHFPQTNHITFEPGARSGWHTHGGMIILVTGGVGYYQEDGKPAQIIRKGDVLECPEGVRHWHGAVPDSWFSQMVIYDSQYRGPRESGEDGPVTDAEYASLETEEYEGRNVDADHPFMFQRGNNPTTMETFNGSVYLSSIIGADNVAGAPGLHYVVFEPGVINNWHIHEGGQILIATDGIGYHQMEGEPVQVLHPGDVALCPPGVKHWHGGSADSSFAHIAVNTNPELTDLEWFDRISDDEYRQLTSENENK